MTYKKNYIDYGKGLFKGINGVIEKYNGGNKMSFEIKQEILNLGAKIVQKGFSIEFDWHNPYNHTYKLLISKYLNAKDDFGHYNGDKVETTITFTDLEEITVKEKLHNHKFLKNSCINKLLIERTKEREIYQGDGPRFKGTYFFFDEISIYPSEEMECVIAPDFDRFNYNWEELKIKRNDTRLLDKYPEAREIYDLVVEMLPYKNQTGN